MNRDKIKLKFGDDFFSKISNKVNGIQLRDREKSYDNRGDNGARRLRTLCRQGRLWEELMIALAEEEIFNIKKEHDA